MIVDDDGQQMTEFEVSALTYQEAGGFGAEFIMSMGGKILRKERGERLFPTNELAMAAAKAAIEAMIKDFGFEVTSQNEGVLH